MSMYIEEAMEDPGNARASLQRLIQEWEKRHAAAQEEANEMSRRATDRANEEEACRHVLSALKEANAAITGPRAIDTKSG